MQHAIIFLRIFLDGRGRTCCKQSQHNLPWGIDSSNYFTFVSTIILLVDLECFPANCLSRRGEHMGCNDRFEGCCPSAPSLCSVCISSNNMNGLVSLVNSHVFVDMSYADVTGFAIVAGLDIPDVNSTMVPSNFTEEYYLYEYDNHTAKFYIYGTRRPFWKVRMVRDRGEFYFGEGWVEFVNQTLSSTTGWCLLTFKYEGKMQFLVSRYMPNGDQIDHRQISQPSMDAPLVTYDISPSFAMQVTPSPTPISKPPLLLVEGHSHSLTFWTQKSSLNGDTDDETDLDDEIDTGDKSETDDELDTDDESESDDEMGIDDDSVEMNIYEDDELDDPNEAGPPSFKVRV
ncbi:hypothetical protein M0R45_016002 [Rubus argutus]|uniref:TF-B3 domain-containing protein n=1 Tax=Rubus argutus TaxID=59490 RepID=A0AAW1XS70_RUBAR